jgi:hypothetical protein
MSRIIKTELRLVDLKPMVERTDAIQSFVSQETPILTITDEDGMTGTGYSYTIGSGGSAIVALLQDHLLPRLIGMNAEEIESNWRTLLFGIHALAVGPVSSVAAAPASHSIKRWEVLTSACLCTQRRVAGCISAVTNSSQMRCSCSREASRVRS